MPNVATVYTLTEDEIKVAIADYLEHAYQKEFNPKNINLKYFEPMITYLGDPKVNYFAEVVVANG